ncbi:MAG: hypothetical protein J1F33_06350 [Clostridiales bacterium]|nr:hypothetical protein [Clostridiales bacterium]
MKKILVTILSLILVLSCFACADKPKEDKKEESSSKPPHVRMDTFIRDVEGNEKCFWEDGKVRYTDFVGSGRQQEKSAILFVGVKYNMCFHLQTREVDFINICDIFFTYDEEIFEITENSEEENHFILKVLQPCLGEKFYVKILGKNSLDDSPESKGFPVTITTEEE